MDYARVRDLGMLGRLGMCVCRAAVPKTPNRIGSILTATPLIRIIQGGVPAYLKAVGDGATTYDIKFASLAVWPKTVSDQIN